MAAETPPVIQVHEKKLEVDNMRMFRWTMGKFGSVRLLNDTIRQISGVMDVLTKAQYRRFPWFGHIIRREDDDVTMWITIYYVRVAKDKVTGLERKEVDNIV